jgi:hypothetical protein
VFKQHRDAERRRRIELALDGLDDVVVFKQHRDAERRRRSAINLIKTLLSPELDLYPPHRKKFLKLALGKLTEAEGCSKKKTRFRSRASLTTPQDVQHEHVYPRARMADALLANPTRVEEIVAQAVGCVVTVEEHEKLTEIDRDFPEVDGWARYEKAGIVVIDMTTGREVDFSRPLHAGQAPAEVANAS